MTEFIAEVCSNHNNDLNRALTLIDTAADIGCSAVKFQLFRVDRLYAPEVLAHPDYEFVRQRKAWELPLKWLPILSNRCRQRDIEFGCTPFYPEAVDELLSFVSFYKIASYNLLHDDLLAKVAGTGKPVILSTGMATGEEIERAVNILFSSNCEHLTLLHCVSVYPTPIESCHNMFISSLRRILHYGRRGGVGWSDHTVNPGVIYYFALISRVSVVEFHLDLDGKGNEYHLGHCWLPGQIGPVIEAVRDAMSVMAEVPAGEFSEAEEKERLWRADPGDGLRPLREVRDALSQPKYYDLPGNKLTTSRKTKE